MRKILILIASVSLLSLTACDKKKDNNNPYANNPYGYAPNSCFQSGGANQFRWANGQCIDVRTNQPTATQNCQSASFGFSQDPRCQSYGGYGQFGYSFGADRCSQVYGPGWVTSRGYLGELVCVNAQTWGYVQNYANQYYGQMPVNYGGYYQTCVPGGNNINNCNCQSFGGTLGWVSGGAWVGYCF